LIEVKNEASLSTTGIWDLPCPLWVISGYRGQLKEGPLYPQKRTLISTAVMSDCHEKPFPNRRLEVARKGRVLTQTTNRPIPQIRNRDHSLIPKFTVVRGLSMSGFERLDRLSLPRRARRCA
jgi:hypothetical protein